MKLGDSRIYLLSNSHIDVAWLWPKKETIIVCLRTFEKVIKQILKYGITYAQSTALYYHWMEKKYPEIFKTIKKLVRDGLWEIVGGSWVEFDANMPLGESIIRQFLYGKKYLYEKFGVDVKVAWFPDSFGFPISLPKILKSVGIDYFVTCKLNWNDTNKFPYNIFLWMSDDGSSIIAYQTVGSYDDPFDVSRVMKYLKNQLDKNINIMLYLYGKGDHGGGPSDSEIKRIMDARNRDPNMFRLGLAVEFFDEVKKLLAEGRIDIPSWNDELYLEFHRGVYTVYPKIKKLIRTTETMLIRLEFLQVLARILTGEQIKVDMAPLWRILLTNQCHDVLSGTISKDAGAEAENELTRCLKLARELEKSILGLLSRKLKKELEDKGLLVINSLCWERDLVLDLRKVLPRKQIEHLGHKYCKITKIPGFGLKFIEMEDIVFDGDVSLTRNGDNIVVENRYYRVDIDGKKGLITQIYDKKRGQNILSGPIFIRIYKDEPCMKRRNFAGVYAHVFDAWEIYIHDNKTAYIDLINAKNLAILEDSSLLVKIESTFEYWQREGEVTRFNVRYIIDDTDVIKIEIHADWRCTHRMAKLVIPLNTDVDRAIYGAPYGKVLRVDYTSPRASRYERAKYEVPSTGWVSVEIKDFGVAISTISRFGFSKNGGIIEISLLRSPTYPSEMGIHLLSLLPRWATRPEFLETGFAKTIMRLMAKINKFVSKNHMDIGEHKFVIALKTTKDNILDPIKMWMEQIFEPIVSASSLDIYNAQIIKIEPDTVVSYVKLSEDKSGLIIRVWNPLDRAQSLKILSDKITMSNAWLCNALEEPIEKIKLTKNVAKFKIGPNEIMTIRIDIGKTKASFAFF